MLGLKIGVIIERIERGLVVMGYVVHVFREVMWSIKRGDVEKVGAPPKKNHTANH